MRVDWEMPEEWIRERTNEDGKLALSLDDWGEIFHRNDASTWLSAACIYCGGAANSEDHVIPRSQGGTDDPLNCVPACLPCNVDKSTQTPEQWRGLDSSEIYYGSPRHWALIKARGYKGRTPYE